MRTIGLTLDDEIIHRLDALAKRDGRTRTAEAKWLLLLAIEWAEANPPLLTVRVTAGEGGGGEALVR
jgi:hypothetical protein